MKVVPMNSVYRMIVTVLAVVLPLLAVETPTISVLYFSNLSPEKGYANLHKAMAEILTAELAADKAVTLVEREQLEKVMTEIELGQTGAVDEGSAPKVGSLLGAKYLLTGSYIIDKKQITVIVKLIGAEKGTIVGSGKVDGTTRDFSGVMADLAVTAAGIVAKLHPSVKPPQPAASDVSFETAVQFGQALDKKDKGDLKDAETVLASIVDAAPDFQYAKITLEDVRQRLKALTDRHDLSIEQLKEGDVSFMDFNRIAGDYLSQMKYMDLLMYCVKVRANPPKPPEGTMIKGAEMVDFYSVTAAFSLRRWEFVVREGERFLKDNPGSMYFNTIRTYVKNAALEYEAQKIREQDVLSSVTELTDKLKTAKDADLHELNYRIGMEFFNKQLYERALKYLKDVDYTAAAKAADNQMPDLVLFNKFMCYYHNFDKKGVTETYYVTLKAFPHSPFLDGMRPVTAFFGE